MTTELLERIRRAADALRERGAREFYLFGSAATGRLRQDSDIDMAVSGLPPELFFEAMGDAREALMKPLDLIDLDEDNLFTRYLKKKGELQRVG